MAKKDNKDKPSKVANVKKRITNLFELPKEIIMNLPLISITGNEEVNIENFKGVIEYTETRIRINTSCGVLKILGKNLFLKQITTESIVVTGVITGLEYLL